MSTEQQQQVSGDWYQRRQPKVRSACEPCHERKIRCQSSTSGSSCQACQLSGRKCVFVLSSRAGRPRRARKLVTNSNIACTSDARMPIPASESSQKEDKLSPQLDLQDTTTKTSLDWMDFDNYEEANFFNEDYTAITPDLDDSGLNTFPFSDSWHGDMDKILSLSTSSSDGYNLDLHSSPDSSPPNGQRSRSQGELEGDFEAEACTKLVQTCVQLQGVYENLQSTGVPHESPLLPTGQTQSIIQTLHQLDAAGDVIIAAISLHSERPPSISLHVPALPALVIATLLKLLDICSILTQESRLKPQTLSQARLLKRIDFNIMQARSALMRICFLYSPLKELAQSVLTSALRIHREIKSAIDELPAEFGG